MEGPLRWIGSCAWSASELLRTSFTITFGRNASWASNFLVILLPNNFSLCSSITLCKSSPVARTLAGKTGFWDSAVEQDHFDRGCSHNRPSTSQNRLRPPLAGKRFPVWQRTGWRPGNASLVSPMGSSIHCSVVYGQSFVPRDPRCKSIEAERWKPWVFGSRLVFA